jgi:MFS family permease
MIFGALGWGIIADVFGRRAVFYSTLVIGGVFGGIAGLSPSYVVYCLLLVASGLGVGGNIPVDGMVYFSHSAYLYI